MRPFGYVRPPSARAAAAAGPPARRAARSAAGPTSCACSRPGSIAPRSWWTWAACPDCRPAVEARASGLRAGAAVRLAALELDPAVAARYPVLAQAVAGVATPQIRNRATLAGSLLQRPACPYYRGGFDCFVRDGSPCGAPTATTGAAASSTAGPCVAGHPSDTAAALLALDASWWSPAPARPGAASLESLYAPPDAREHRELRLGAGETITEVRVPPPPPARSEPYLRARDRATWAFALVGLAAAGALEDGRFVHLRLVAAGVAPVPWRLPRRRRRRARGGSSPRSPEAARSARSPAPGRRRRAPTRSPSSRAWWSGRSSTSPPPGARGPRASTRPAPLDSGRTGEQAHRMQVPRSALALAFLTTLSAGAAHARPSPPPDRAATVAARLLAEETLSQRRLPQARVAHRPDRAPDLREPCGRARGRLGDGRDAQGRRRSGPGRARPRAPLGPGRGDGRAHLPGRRGRSRLWRSVGASGTGPEGASGPVLEVASLEELYARGAEGRRAPSCSSTGPSCRTAAPRTATARARRSAARGPARGGEAGRGRHAHPLARHRLAPARPHRLDEPRGRRARQSRPRRSPPRTPT